jgi:hypothetical protein
VAILKPAKPYYNIDTISKLTVSEWIYDGYLDETGCFCSRFGCDVFADTLTGQPGDGLFWWDKEAILVAITGGRAFTCSQAGVITEVDGAAFEIGTPTTFAAGQTVGNDGVLMAANGGPINYCIDGLTLQQMPPNAPQTVTHVVYNGLRWLANEKDTARFYFSDVDPDTGDFDPEYWDALENPLTGDARGDNIQGLYQAWDDIAVWGAEGRELWQVTGSSPPLEARLGAFCDAGLIAPYSVKAADNTLFALCNVDSKPAVIRLQANDPLIISIDIEQVLDSYTTVTDAIGDIASIAGQSFYILTFPTEDVSWAYNIKKKEWYQWSYWDSESATRHAYMYRNFVYCRQWGMHFCQSRVDGKIYKVNPASDYDGTDKMRPEWITSWIASETFTDKILLSLRFILKRAQGTILGTEPKIMVKWRDNGKMEWKVEREISLGLLGQYECIRTLHNLGMFRTRQISIALSDPAKLVLVGLEPNML